MTNLKFQIIFGKRCARLNGLSLFFTRGVVHYNKFEGIIEITFYYHNDIVGCFVTPMFGDYKKWCDENNLDIGDNEDLTK